jgi:hypothetical protein
MGEDRSSECTPIVVFPAKSMVILRSSRRTVIRKPWHCDERRIYTNGSRSSRLYRLLPEQPKSLFSDPESNS